MKNRYIDLIDQTFDFPICVVPILTQDMEKTDILFWSYFCQISDFLSLTKK